MKEIGRRAAKEIYNRQDSERGIDELLDEIELTRASLWQYKSGRFAPSGAVLHRMALAGYDVIYILTGERGHKRKNYKGGHANEQSR